MIQALGRRSLMETMHPATEELVELEVHPKTLTLKSSPKRDKPVEGSSLVRARPSLKSILF
jgi:hypothetical protein